MPLCPVYPRMTRMGGFTVLAPGERPPGATDGDLLLEDNPAIREKYSRRFEHILLLEIGMLHLACDTHRC